MAMAKFTVDLVNKLFVAKAGVRTVDVKVDLYSDAKEHWISDARAMGFDFPIRGVAGDTTSTGFVEPWFFLRDGWKIRPDEASHTLIFTGNFELDAGETGDLVVPTLGGFTVLARNVLSNKATVNNGVSDATPLVDETFRQWRAILTNRKARPAQLPFGYRRRRK